MSQPSEWINRREHSDGVIELQLCHAPENRLNIEFLKSFDEEIASASEQPDVRAVLLTSPFKDFSLGLDEDAPASMELATALNATFLSLFAFPKPLVIATVGVTAGAGMFFVLCSDIRVAHARSSFELSEIKAGRNYPDALMAIARTALDTNTQRRLMLTGQRIGPIAARNANLIEVLADDLDDLHGYSLKEARKLASLSSAAFADIKLELRRDTIRHIEALLDAEFTSAESEDAGAPSRAQAG